MWPGMSLRSRNDTSSAMSPSEHVKQCVAAEDIKVSENPDESGSLLAGHRPDRYVISPRGDVRVDRLLPPAAL